jgi:hypothetical protein
LCLARIFEVQAYFLQNAYKETSEIPKKLTYFPSACLVGNIGGAIYENHMLFKARVYSLIPETTIFNIISKLASEDKAQVWRLLCCRWFF